MPKDFSQDGAYGAIGGNPASATNTSQTFSNDASGYGSTAIPMSGAMLSAQPMNNFSTGDAGDNVNYSSEASIKASPGVTTYGPDQNINRDTVMMFDTGGEVPGDGFDAGENDDGSGGGSPMKSALQTVQQALNYGRKLHGLDQLAMNTTGFSQSNNIEDRRSGDDSQPDMSRRTKFDDVVDRVKDFGAGYNSLSQQAGINDVGTTGSSPSKGIPDDDQGGQ